MFAVKALSPIPTLLEPVFVAKAEVPTATFAVPVVTVLKELEPTATLLLPVVIASPAL